MKSDLRVLITGGAGYVGSRVTAHLLELGHRVTVFDKLIYGAEALLPFYGAERFKLVRGDVRDRDALAAVLEGADAIVHFAAVVGEQACSIDPEQSWSINVEGTKTVVAAARCAGVSQLIFISTCSNYGVAKPGELADENSPLNPLSDYARAKVECEKFMLQGLSRPTCTILRLGTICGLSGRMRFDLLVSEMAKRCSLSERLDVFSPDAWRPFLHIVDAARAIDSILQSPGSDVDGRTFNVVGENYQKRGLVDLARRHFPEAEIVVTDKSPDLRDYRVDGSRISRELGFTPLRTVEDAFCETAKAVGEGL